MIERTLPGRDRAALERSPRRAAKRSKGARPFVSVGLLFSLAVAACSLGNIHRDDCTTNAQCAAAFGAASTCVSGYCTAAHAVGCQQKRADGTPCGGCPPTVTTEFENACTTAACAHFDNTTRLTKLNPDGSLPPLP